MSCHEGDTGVDGNTCDVTGVSLLIANYVPTHHSRFEAS